MNGIRILINEHPVDILQAAAREAIVNRPEEIETIAISIDTPAGELVLQTYTKPNTVMPAADVYLRVTNGDPNAGPEIYHKFIMDMPTENANTIKLKPTIKENCCHYTAELKNGLVLDLTPETAPSPWHISILDENGNAIVNALTKKTPRNTGNKTTDDYANNVILPMAIERLKNMLEYSKAYKNLCNEYTYVPESQTTLRWYTDKTGSTMKYTATYPDPMHICQNGTITITETPHADKYTHQYQVSMADCNGRLITATDFSIVTAKREPSMTRFQKRVLNALQMKLACMEQLENVLNSIT